MGLSAVRLQKTFEVLSEELRDGRNTTEAQQYAVERLSARCRKRAKLGSGQRDKAVSSFVDANALVATTPLYLDPHIRCSARQFIVESFERFNAIHDPTLIQVSFDYRHLQDRWRFGPGASNGVEGSHAVYKFHQPMTCTAPCESLVKRLREADPYFRRFDFLHGSGVDSSYSGSRLTTVPKNEETDRTIAIEPSGNMAVQLALGGYVEDVLRFIGLDIRTQQPKNKLLAMLGSLGGGFSTIDMKWASDMIQIRLCRQLLPRGLFDAMLRSRSPETVLPNGEKLQLNMMSTMGNGFTFPVMTLILASLLYAVTLEAGGPRNFINWDKAAVFGDDIVCRDDLAPRLIAVLKSAGFLVNYEKSYLHGPFRESCGGDYYRGEDVTPFYLKELACDQHIYVAMNVITAWCGKVGYGLPRTLMLLRSFIDGDFLFVPEWLGDDAGYRTAEVPPRYKYYRIVQARESLVDDPVCGDWFKMPLALGGYLVGDALYQKRIGKSAEAHEHVVYVVRPYKTRYKLMSTRLPRGYLDGRDPQSRTPSVSSYASSIAFMFR